MTIYPLLIKSQEACGSIQALLSFHFVQKKYSHHYFEHGLFGFSQWSTIVDKTHRFLIEKHEIAKQLSKYPYPNYTFLMVNNIDI